MTKCFPQSASVLMFCIRNFGLPFSLYHCWPLSEKIVASIILQANLFCSPSMALPTLGSFQICLSVLWPHLPHSENTGPSSLPSSQHQTLPFHLQPWGISLARRVLSTGRVCALILGLLGAPRCRAGPGSGRWTLRDSWLCLVCPLESPDTGAATLLDAQ